jgi:hypothetical protein
MVTELGVELMTVFVLCKAGAAVSLDDIESDAPADGMPHSINEQPHILFGGSLKAAG